MCSELDCIETFKPFLESVVSRAVSTLGKDRTDTNAKLLHALLFSLLALVNHKPTVDKCISEVKQLLANETYPIDADLRTTMLS